MRLPSIIAIIYNKNARIKKVRIKLCYRHFNDLGLHHKDHLVILVIQEVAKAKADLHGSQVLVESLYH